MTEHARGSRPIPKRILIVEDERLVARELQHRLRDLGYDVPITVARADDCLREASDHCPDLVLMDIRIEGELDGIETAGLLRRRFDIPIVYLTAHSDDATIERAKATHPSGYLVKPLKPGELRSVVEIALYKHGMERELRNRERWFSTTLRSIGDGVVTTDAEGLVTFVNGIAEGLTGWSSKDAVGKPLAEVLRATDDAEHPIAHALRAGRVVHLDSSLQAKDGLDVTVADTVAPIVDDHGTMLGSVIVFRDVTEQRRLQRQLEMADRLASLGTMAAGIAHEINNPLAAILANGEMALEVARAHAGDPGAQWIGELNEMLGEALDGARRVQRIVADMRTLARPRSETESEASVAAAVEHAVRMTKHELRRRARVSTSVPDELRVRAEENRLSQVLINLLVNAAHAFDTVARSHEVEVVARGEARGVVIEVRDNGCGIPDDVRPRIFEPFFTTKDVGQGMGLGLSICHGIVASFGGTIEVESTIGAGSTFRLVLPAVQAVPVATTDQPSADKPRRGRILIVDDEVLLRTAIARVLRRDHDVTVADSAETAVGSIRTGARFDIILCDLMMPEMSGMDVYDAVLGIDPVQASRIVFLTGGAFSQRSAAFLAATSNIVLLKPFELTDLRVEIARIVADRGITRAPAG